MNKDIVTRIMLRFGYSAIKNYPRASTLYAKEHFKGKEITCLELGVAKGENSKSILKELNVKNIYLIDSYINTKEYPNASKWKEEAIEELREYNYKISWMFGKSSNTLNKLKKESIDYIYIDGSHMYEEVLHDIKKCYTLLKSGGVLAGHDILNHRGVSKAIIEFCYKNKIDPVFSGVDWILVKK